jgi:hypothetical protein
VPKPLDENVVALNVKEQSQSDLDTRPQSRKITAVGFAVKIVELGGGGGVRFKVAKGGCNWVGEINWRATVYALSTLLADVEGCAHAVTQYRRLPQCFTQSCEIVTVMLKLTGARNLVQEPGPTKSR